MVEEDRGRRGGGARGVAIGLVVVLVLGAAAWRGIASRTKVLADLSNETAVLATTTVSVITATARSPEEEIVLPGSLQAFADASIYARTSGYLRRRLVDIGTKVKAGQLLAEVDAPELEQQLQQARADLATGEANLRLAEITATRYADLLRTDSVAQQDADNATGTLEARRTAVESARHNVQRLEQMQAFTRIYAPFDGVVTARNTDVGALIDPGSGGAGRELFHVASIDRLRAFVNVPQAYSQVTRPGLAAELTLAEFAGRSFPAALVRTSKSIEVASRTLLVELEVDNASGDLFPGAYAEVHFKLPRPSTASLVPVGALVFRGENPQVAVVGEGGRVRMVSVTLGRDFGTDVEVLAGLKGTEAIVANPPDSLVDGQVVRAVKVTAPTRESHRERR